MKTSREMMLALHGPARLAALNRFEPFTLRRCARSCATVRTGVRGTLANCNSEHTNSCREVSGGFKKNKRAGPKQLADITLRTLLKTA
jgi:hypothetical protein